MQTTLSHMQPLLDTHGHLTTTGSFTAFLWEYKRSLIQAPWYSIKEWDEYYIGNEDYFAVITISDVSYLGINAITLFDIKQKRVTTKCFTDWLTIGNKNLPQSPLKGDVRIVHKDYQIEVTHKDDLRIIDLRVDHFSGKQHLVGRLILSSPPKASLVKISTLNKQTNFRYNYTLNNLRVEGTLSLGHNVVRFQPTHAFATIDWVRGAWQTKRWGLWGSASGIVNHYTLGLILSVDSSTKQQSECLIIYNDAETLIAPIEISMGNNTMSTHYWSIVSEHQQLNVRFTPVFENEMHDTKLQTTSKLILGYFSGEIHIEHHKCITITQLFGFLKLENKKI